MSSQTLGLLIGGLVPAFMFGFSNVFLKAGTQQGVSTPVVLVSVGCAVVLTGVVLFFVLPDRGTAGMGYAFLSGACWAVGMTCVTVALQRFHVPLSTIVPLFNLNTLITVVAALWIFSEWKEVGVWQLLTGSVLVVAGGVMVAKA